MLCCGHSAVGRRLQSQKAGLVVFVVIIMPGQAGRFVISGAGHVTMPAVLRLEMT
mgnify:CR=1 FL=1